MTMLHESRAEHDYSGLFAPHLVALTEYGSELRGCCPFHEDKNPSWTGNRDTGLWRCFGCGAQGNAQQFAERLGEKERRGSEPLSRKIVATYDYIDEHGALLYQVMRFEPKDFRQRKPDGNGGWTWKLNGVRRVLYRLPDILKVDTVYLVEGEKDADRLWSLGIPATTNPQGAGKWQDTYGETLHHKKVVILPDNDAVGEQHAQTVARSLLGKASAVKIVRLPDLPAKGDVSDWLETGHSKEELATLVKATPILRVEDLQSPHAPKDASADDGSTNQTSTPILTRLVDVAAVFVQWLWRGYIPLGKISILDGDPGLGKSLLSLDLAARVTTRRTMPDGTLGLDEARGVVLLTVEDDLGDTIRPRLEAAGADLSHISALTGIREDTNERLPTLLDLNQLRKAIDLVTAKLVIIDPLMAYLPGTVNSFRDQDIRRVLAPLAVVAAETGVAVMVIRHLNKTSGGNAIYRGGGSIGIIGAARSGLLVAKDPDDEDRRILAVTKSNLARIPSALAYRVTATAEEVPYLTWEGPTQHTPASLLTIQGDGEERSAVDEAKVFLREMLDAGAVPAKEVQHQARQAGISDASLRRAKTALRVKVQKRGGFFGKKEGQQWCWMLPIEDAQDPPEGAHIHAGEHLQQSSEKNTRKFNDVPEGAHTYENEHLQPDYEEID